MQLQHPKIKALAQITNVLQKFKNNNFSNNNSLHKYIILPNNSDSNNKKNLNNLGIKTVTNTSKTIKNLINNKNNNIPIKSRADEYEIPFLD